MSASAGSSASRGIYLYKFVPYRPGFRATVTEAEATIMREHVGCWRTLPTRAAGGSRVWVLKR
jgi:hypothetical protein